METNAPRLRELLADRTLAVILLLSFLGGFGGGVASPALPGIASTFSVSEARIGLVMTVYFLGAFVTLPLSGVLMDAYGRRPVVLALLLLFGGAGTAIAFVRDFRLILALRALQGAGFVGTIPISITLVGDLYMGASGSSAQGLRSSATGFSRIAIPGVAGLLAGFAWHYPFLLNGLAVVAFLLVYRYLPETGSIRGGESGDLDESPLGYVETARETIAGFLAEVRDPALIVLLGSVFVLFLTRFTIETFVPLYAVRSMGASSLAAGVALSLSGIGRFLVSPFAGSFESRVSRRTAFASTVAAVALGIGLVGVVDSVLPLYLVMVGFSVGDSLYNPILNNAVTGIATEEYRGRVVSVMEMLKTGAVTASPVVFGAVLALVGFERMFLLAGLVSLLPIVPIVLVLDR